MAGVFISGEYGRVSSHGVTWLSAVSRPGGWVAGRSADSSSACGNQIPSQITANHLSPREAIPSNHPGRERHFIPRRCQDGKKLLSAMLFSLNSPPPNLSWAPFGTIEQQLTRLEMTCLSNPKHRHTHAATHSYYDAVPVRMFLKKIYFLSSSQKPTIMSGLAPNLWRIFVFSNLVRTCGPEIHEHKITQELWETLGKHMLADACMQACIKHTHTEKCCSLSMQLFPFGIPWVVTLWHSLCFLG